jgi:hypothetical protein
MDQAGCLFAREGEVTPSTTERKPTQSLPWNSSGKPLAATQHRLAMANSLTLVKFRRKNPRQLHHTWCHLGSVMQGGNT